MPITFREKFLSEKDWRKRAFLVLTLHVKKKLADKKWRMIDTAKYLKISKTIVLQEIHLANALDELNGCKTRYEALKKLTKH